MKLINLSMKVNVARLHKSRWATVSWSHNTRIGSCDLFCNLFKSCIAWASNQYTVKCSYYSLCVAISFGRVWIVCMFTILSRLYAITNTHATIARAHARHAIARAKLKISDRKVLKSARAPNLKKALDKNITVLKDFDFKTCRRLNEKKNVMVWRS